MLALRAPRVALAPGLAAVLLVIAAVPPALARSTATLDGSDPVSAIEAAAAEVTTGSESATLAVVAGATRYVTAWTAIRTAADEDATVEVTVGPRYKVVLTGASSTDDGVAWLSVTWTSPSRHGTGWIRAAATSATRPSGTNAEANVNALSASLARYLAQFGTRVGVEVEDVTGRTVYTSNASSSFITASSVKVAIMLAVMARAEAAGRSLTSTEKSLMTVMIEQSSNSAASALYKEIGGKAGLAAWARRFGISGLVPEGAGPSWGYTLIRPSAMVNILEKLRLGRLTNATNRAYALYLMRHVTAFQRFGVGTGSPGDATVAMKNGWVPGPDGLWAVNSSGIVTLGGETYVISVYTRSNASFSQGKLIVTYVAKLIGAALT